MSDEYERRYDDGYDDGYEDGKIAGAEEADSYALINDLESEFKGIRAVFPCDIALRARLFRLGACGASGDPWQALARILERAEERS